MIVRIFAATMLAALLVIGIVIACGKTPTKPGPRGVTNDVVYLVVGESKLLGWQTIEVGFDSVLIDDRCILGSPDNCFYGRAAIDFWLKKTGLDTIRLTLEINTGDSLWGSGGFLSVDTAGLLITLVSVDPHPRLGETISYDDYTAGLLLTDNFAADSIGASVIPIDITTDYLRMDEYDLDSAWIVSDSIGLHVRHGGGCAEHYYQLFMNPDVFAESLPVQADLYLRHYNNADFCRAYLSKKPIFDLGPLRDKYFEYYGGSDSGAVLLNIHGYTDGSGEDLQLLYNFAR